MPKVSPAAPQPARDRSIDLIHDHDASQPFIPLKVVNQSRGRHDSRPRVLEPEAAYLDLRADGSGSVARDSPHRITIPYQTEGEAGGA